MFSYLALFIIVIGILMFPEAKKEEEIDEAEIKPEGGDENETAESIGSRKTLLFLLINLTPISLLMSLCYCKSMYDMRFVELQGSLLFLGHGIASMFLMYSGLF